MPSTKHYDLDIDATLGENNASNNVISSQKAIKSYIDNNLSSYEPILKTVNILSTSGTIALSDNSINSITPNGTVTFTLPTITNNTVFHQILVQINLTTVQTINLGLSNPKQYFNKKQPDLSNIGVYNLYYEYDKAKQYWVCGDIPKGAASQ